MLPADSRRGSAFAACGTEWPGGRRVAQRQPHSTVGSTTCEGCTASPAALPPWRRSQQLRSRSLRAPLCARSSSTRNLQTATRMRRRPVRVKARPAASTPISPLRAPIRPPRSRHDSPRRRRRPSKESRPRTQRPATRRARATSGSTYGPKENATAAGRPGVLGRDEQHREPHHRARRSTRTAARRARTTAASGSARRAAASGGRTRRPRRTRSGSSSSPSELDQNSVGVLTLDPTDKKGNTIYLGTGEANRCSSGCEAGVGIYKSTDGGNKWKKLDDTCVSNAMYHVRDPRQRRVPRPRHQRRS